MKWRCFRRNVFSVTVIGLMAVYLCAALPTYGSEISPSIVKSPVERPPIEDIRLPAHRPITSPGFPSELSGMCLTWQGCLEYCKTHQADPACDRLIKDNGDDKSLGVDSSSEQYRYFRKQVEKLTKNPDDEDLRKWIIENAMELSPSSLYSEEAMKLKTRADAMIAAARTTADLTEAATVYKKALEFAPWDRQIYHDLGMALQKSGDMAYAAYTAASGKRDICEPDMRQTAEAIMARYRDASNNLKLSLAKTGDRAVTEKSTLISIDKNLLTVYRLKYSLDGECCPGCRGIKPIDSNR